MVTTFTYQCSENVCQSFDILFQMSIQTMETLLTFSIQPSYQLVEYSN